MTTKDILIILFSRWILNINTFLLQSNLRNEEVGILWLSDPDMKKTGKLFLDSDLTLYKLFKVLPIMIRVLRLKVACEDEKLERALDYCYQMLLPKFLVCARDFANEKKLRTLATNIQIILVRFCVLLVLNIPKEKKTTESRQLSTDCPLNM